MVPIKTRLHCGEFAGRHQASKRLGVCGQLIGEAGLSEFKIILFCAVATLVSAFALSAALAQGSPQEEAACRPDVMRLCRAAAPDTMRVLACLQANRSRLSRGCKAVLASHGQ
jgi:hypothetical protein